MKLISLKDALDFADFYHNALRNAERRTVEEEFAKRNIPTISPVEIIEKEIKEYENLIPSQWALAKQDALKDLQEKFKSLS